MNGVRTKRRSVQHGNYLHAPREASRMLILPSNCLDQEVLIGDHDLYIFSRFFSS